MKKYPANCTTLLIICLFFTNSCCHLYNVKVEQSDNVCIIKQTVAAEWQTIKFANQKGLPMRQLLFDKKIWLRESDLKRTGKIDDVRIRLTSGEYVEIKDTNGDGKFHVVKQIPPDPKER